MKNFFVSGVIDSGVSYAEIFARARAIEKIALSGRASDECVDVPCDVIVNGTDALSAVEMLTYCTLPAAFLMIQPPSLSTNSASMSGQCSRASHVVLNGPPLSSSA